MFFHIFIKLLSCLSYKKASFFARPFSNSQFEQSLVIQTVDQLGTNWRHNRVEYEINDTLLNNENPQKGQAYMKTPFLKTSFKNLKKKFR